MITGIGAILAYGGTTAPPGCLICDGSAVSRTTYSGLFAVIGTRFGAGDGTTFNLPNLSGSVTYIIIYVDDTTGSGATVLSHGPVLGNPTLGAASATSLAFSSTAGIIGTTTNNNAAAGSVGEYVTANVQIPDAIDLTTEVAANVTSITLTPGDWDVRGQIAFQTTSTTKIIEIEAAISGASASRPGGANDTEPVSFLNWANFAPTITTFVVPTTTGRVSIGSTSTIYLVAFAAFSVSTLTAYGFISARRMR